VRPLAKLVAREMISFGVGGSCGNVGVGRKIVKLSGCAVAWRSPRSERLCVKAVVLAHRSSSISIQRQRERRQ
jgi:hypothetical protein